jgi:ubiquinone/menaquinone biosynthesis C-methylase UbiE
VTDPAAFDAFFGDFYLRAYAEEARQDEAEAQALGAMRLAETPDGGAVLDVPCGFGRHSVALAAAGFDVTGVDSSVVLLDEARRRAPEISFVRADYRSLPLPDASFDTAVNLFSSIGFLGDEEDTKVFAEIRRVLRPDGRLVVETMHRDLLVLTWNEQQWHSAGAGRLLLEQRMFDPAAGILQLTQTLIDSDSQRESRTWSTRVYAATELVHMLFAAGFSRVRAYGDFEGSAFDPGTLLVLVARP